jgi:riboflavin kinase/FMN adenylyltransferase
MVLFPDDHGLQLINTLEEKIDLLSKQGIDHLLILPFTHEFSRLSSLEFIRDILVDRIGTKVLVIGFNHRFGKNREGSFAHLKEYAPTYGFEIDEISMQDLDEVSVSSTRIREAIKLGQVKLASRFLGRPYEFTGTVVMGRQLGRTIGFPTANIKILNQIKPLFGVYSVKIIFNKKTYKGIANFGVRPTFGSSNPILEVNVFGKNHNFYNKNIKVLFIDFIRKEKKFINSAMLVNQIKKDIKVAKISLNKK